MPEYEVSHVEKGTLFFSKVKPRKVSFEAIVLNIIPKVDRSGRPFITVVLQAQGEKSSKWNCFDKEQAKKIKPHACMQVTGTYFGPFKRRLDSAEVIKKIGGKK